MKIAKNHVISAGVIIINEDNKILLIKPKGLSKGQYSIPKGQREKGEKLKETAIREAYEEIGLILSESDLGKQYVINYFNNNILTKRVFCYLFKMNKEFESNFKPKLQKEEVDMSNFYSKEEFNELIFWRYKELAKISEIWS